MTTVRTLLLYLIFGVMPLAARLDLTWPTPNPAFLEGRPIRDYVQPTASGEPESGLFGCVRSNGFQFHEGIDLKPVNPRHRGEPTDEIYAAMDGVVRHISPHSGESNYGRYVVLEHPGATPAIYTLYAHLQSVTPGLAVGTEVKRGQAIGIMGHSAGGSAIPRERAHLHFEMGLMVTRDFQAWYYGQRFGSPNLHGEWNGMNLMGFDPRDFCTQLHAHQVDDVIDYLRRQTVAMRVRVASGRTPDYALRYPSLVKGTLPPGTLMGGWELELLWTGLPLSLRPLAPDELGGLRPGIIQIVDMNREEMLTHRAISLVRGRGAGTTPGKDLQDVIGKLFGP